MVRADVLVMAKSALSTSAAILSRGRTITAWQHEGREVPAAWNPGFNAFFPYDFLESCNTSTVAPWMGR